MRLLFAALLLAPYVADAQTEIQSGDTVYVSGTVSMEITPTADEGDFPIVSYNVFYSIGGGDLQEVSINASEAYTLAGAEGQYEFSLQAVDLYGNTSDTTDPFVFSIEAAAPPSNPSFNIILSCEETGCVISVQ